MKTKIMAVLAPFTAAVWLAVFFLLSSCTAATQKIIEVAGNDLQRTGEIAEKYGKPQVKQCTDFLLASLKSEDGAQASIDALLKEETAGIASSALKAALIAEFARSLNDPAKRTQFEADFRTNCATVAGDIMLNVMRDARTVGSRGSR